MEKLPGTIKCASSQMLNCLLILLCVAKHFLIWQG